MSVNQSVDPNRSLEIDQCDLKVSIDSLSFSISQFPNCVVVLLRNLLLLICRNHIFLNRTLM